MERLISGKLTSKGQLTVPAEIRNYLSLKEGDRLEFVIHENGRLYVIPRKKTTIEDVAGILNTSKTIDPVEARETARKKRSSKRTAKDDRT